MIKVAITDDHILVLQGIEAVLQQEPTVKVVGKFSNPAETLLHLSKERPDILLLDINMPDMNGIDLCYQLTQMYPKLKIIALSSFDETSFVKRILANGACGYLLKNTSTEELMEAFHNVMDGKQFLQKDVQKKMLDDALGNKKSPELLPRLTRREKEVLKAISEERTTQEIAEQLFISPKTVETHRMNLISKLGARNSVGLVRMAMELGLLGKS